MANCWISWRRPLGHVAKVGVEGSNPFARSRKTSFYDFVNHRAAGSARCCDFSVQNDHGRLTQFEACGGIDRLGRCAANMERQRGG